EAAPRPNPLLDLVRGTVEAPGHALQQRRLRRAADGVRAIWQARQKTSRLGQIVAGIDEPPDVERAADLRIAQIDRQAIRLDRVRQLFGVVAGPCVALERDDELVIAQER